MPAHLGGRGPVQRLRQPAHADHHSHVHDAGLRPGADHQQYRRPADTRSAMVAVGLATFGLLDAVRNRILARVGAWFERELGSPILGGAIAEARRAGAASRRSGCTHPPRCRAGSAWWAPSRCSAAPRSTTWPPASGSPRPTARRCVRALNDADAAIRNADAITATSCSAAPCACQRARRTDQFLVRALARPTARSTPAQFRQHRAHLLQPRQRRLASEARPRSRQRPWQQHLLGPGGTERVQSTPRRPAHATNVDQRVQQRRQPRPVAVRLQQIPHHARPREQALARMASSMR